MKELTEKEFVLIRDYIKDNFGINLGNEKKSLIYSRLRSVLQEKGFANFSQYFKYLINDKSGLAVIQFIDKITTNHTFFMRESEHFKYFEEVVLPHIEKTAKTKDLRLWCAGCSSGEEAYTLEMIANDYFCNKPDWNTQILATDISENVLDKAIKGVYENDSVKILPQKWHKLYFKEYGNNKKIVVDEIKKNIIFRKFNLMSDVFPFKRPFQVIFCRNVMIYFNDETRDKLVEKYYNVLEPNGYLFIGHSESLSNTSSKYKYVMPAVYQK